MIQTSVVQEVQLAIAVVKTLILVIGGIVTYLALSAYRRTYDRALGFLAVGFAFIVIGVLLAGVTFELLNVPLGVGILVESLFVLLGLSIIALSLRVR
ncbi:hypothetical protein KM295_06995 [Natronomonas sp. F2-12]|jgi:heme/copper-type cytochrome/quinol oxidase subunit 3|uniref:Uncharacterized protein n=1 Tax=Natronomonas aquatica TaxID=2841590 RepID=A0A9R1CSQ9_9EURY|nr:hypothetical protein [Natronomonas aquatica]MCQ4333230.1 hypothetical protein [Natronomonas aquatica]